MTSKINCYIVAISVVLESNTNIIRVSMFASFFELFFHIVYIVFRMVQEVLFPFKFIFICFPVLRTCLFGFGIGIKKSQH